MVLYSSESTLIEHRSKIWRVHQARISAGTEFLDAEEIRRGFHHLAREVHLKRRESLLETLSGCACPVAILRMAAVPMQGAMREDALEIAVGRDVVRLISTAFRSRSAKV
jgi:hypothetical protein